MGRDLARPWGESFVIFFSTPFSWGESTLILCPNFTGTTSFKLQSRHMRWALVLIPLYMWGTEPERGCHSCRDLQVVKIGFKPSDLTPDVVVFMSFVLYLFTKISQVNTALHFKFWFQCPFADHHIWFHYNYGTGDYPHCTDKETGMLGVQATPP